MWPSKLICKLHCSRQRECWKATWTGQHSNRQWSSFCVCNKTTQLYLQTTTELSKIQNRKMQTWAMAHWFETLQMRDAYIYIIIYIYISERASATTSWCSYFTGCFATLPLLLFQGLVHQRFHRLVSSFSLFLLHSCFLTHRRPQLLKCCQPLWNIPEIWRVADLKISQE